MVEVVIITLIRMALTTMLMIMGQPTTTQEVEVQRTLLLVETLPILPLASRLILPAS